MNFLENLARDHFKYLVDNNTPIQYTIVSGPNSVNVFIFKDKESIPFGILRITSKKFVLENIYNTLKIIIDNANNEGLIETIPKPIKYETYSDLQIISFPYISGEAIKPNTSNITILTSHLKLIRNWLIMLYNINLPNLQIKELIEDELGWKFNCIRERSKIDKSILNELFDKIKSAEKTIINNGIKKVIQHGDLRPQHIIFRKNNKFVIIDWEYCSLSLPTLDWFYFICYYFCPLPPLKSIKEVNNILKRIFFDKNKISQIIINETEKLFNELSIDRELIPNFFVVALFNYLLTLTFFNLTQFKDVINIFYEENNIFK